ncbi:DUF4062 domain-containing protein [Tumebacillus sp. ITR2]|uniref:DUF4062 domain-containing protein n=2 Tax=Tumebacillus amylolyticus TaxID=2801339 RepID=A0ABS1J9L9_9BACL|nr:DUF4062 domain-containing protein [Tumebacillus amylolyticus]
MKKKLQIFVSSTYTDLISERQAAVEAILKAGHIPAGMELFKAGKEQLETIYRWIDESDIYMLILGGRYGSVEEKTGKSYTHLEYEYALDKGMPIFAVVITDKYLSEKVKLADKVDDVREIVNHEKYVGFKKLVDSKLRESFDDLKDIELAVHKTIADLKEQHSFTGWVSGKYAVNTGDIDALQIENRRLTAEISKKDQENKLLVDQLSILTKKDKDNASSTMGKFYEILNDIARKALKNYDEYEITSDEFEELYRMMLKEGFVEGGTVVTGGPGNYMEIFSTDDTRITFIGMQMLVANGY